MLDDLPKLLAGLGPWGIVIGVGVTLLAQWVQRRRNPAPQPNPDPNAPAPAPGPSSTPLLDLLLNALRKRLSPQQRVEHNPDVDPATLAKILKLLDDEIDDS